MRIDFPPEEPWVLPLAGELPINSADNDGWLFDRVCAPCADVRTELTARGFIFRDSPQRRLLRGILSEAAGFLRAAPRLEIAVRAAVAEIVLLRARPAYDISHSEPRWPQTIFISVPGQPAQVSALRAAENIVHEAMHLQLTTLERAHRLVADSRAQMVSPWREESRHLQGVLHGFYVFHCISAFFAAPRLSGILDVEGASHVARRRAQIAKELSRLDFSRLTRGMTPKGRAFLAALAG